MESLKETLEEVYDYVIYLVLNKRLKEAEAFIEKNSSIKSNNIDILNILGIIKYRYCDFKEAKKYFYESLNILEEGNKAKYFLEDMEEPNFKIIEKKYKKALILIEEGQDKKAIELLEEINKERKDLIETKIFLSLLYGKAEDFNRGIYYIESALREDKSNYKIRFLYDQMMVDLNNINKCDELSFSESFFNLMLILNYKINSFYEEEIINKNKEIEILWEELEKIKK